MEGKRKVNEKLTVDNLLEERVALPRSLITMLSSESKSRVDGFILTPFRYEGEGSNRFEYNQRYVIHDSNIFNSQIAVNLEYKARIMSDLLSGEITLGTNDDAFRLFHDYHAVFYRPGVDPSFAQQIQPPNVWDGVMPIPAPLEAVADTIDEVVSISDVRAEDNKSECISRDGNQADNSSSVEQHLSSMSSILSASTSGSSTGNSIQEAWCDIAEQTEEYSYDIHDFLYHAISYPCLTRKVYDNDQFFIVKRDFVQEGENMITSETGALVHSLTYISRVDQVQYTCYIIVSKPKGSNQMHNSGGYQVGVIMTKAVATEVFNFSYPRAYLNAFFLFQKQDLTQNRMPVRFFSREFGSFHLMTFPQCGEFSRKLRDLHATAKKSVPLNILDVGKQLCHLLLCQMKDFGTYVTNEDEVTGLVMTRYFATISEGLDYYSRKVANRCSTEFHKDCVRKAEHWIQNRNGLVHGSKINKQDKKFKTPCNKEVGKFTEYQSHFCTVRFKTIGVSTRYDLKNEGIIIKHMSGHYCSECFRIYESCEDAEQCNYFCLFGAKCVSADSNNRVKDAYGRFFKSA